MQVEEVEEGESADKPDSTTPVPLTSDDTHRSRVTCDDRSRGFSLFLGAPQPLSKHRANTGNTAGVGRRATHRGTWPTCTWTPKTRLSCGFTAHGLSVFLSSAHTHVHPMCAATSCWPERFDRKLASTMPSPLTSTDVPRKYAACDDRSRGFLVSPASEQAHVSLASDTIQNHHHKQGKVMPKKTKKNQSKKQKINNSGKKAIIWHEMTIEEDFTKAASRIFRMLKNCQDRFPNKKRALYIDVQGHRNSEGGFDHDAFELIHYFALEKMAQYLTEVRTPLIHIITNKPQLPLPEELIITDEKNEYSFDFQELKNRPREDSPDKRKTYPTTQAIMAYLGMKEFRCLICWTSESVERAHAVPRSLGGSNDVRNFAPLCTDHHKASPDVADSEAFWSWIDHERNKYSDNRQKAIMEIFNPKEASPGSQKIDDGSDNFFRLVKAELISLYNWKEEDFSAAPWELMEQYQTVLKEATGKHFAIDKKVSTHAWAFNVAKQRIEKE
ncbi:HNH endonuclease [Nocardiopsis sp. FR4]|uniref:HNH endonuclease n=1 Tax=Nocardiopsis sp. FR4 TaxID=2605985 RepID=UPI001915873D|nr:HNH endonuclease signature motif containing protein [Nocardiopsis sp. FR4]